MADLRASEVDEAEFIFNILGGQGTMDAFYLGKAVRALKLNPSLDTLEKLGMTKKEGEKFMKFDEFLPIYSQLRKDKKDQGCYEDFIECLKLYDKNENGRMLVGELSHSLLSLAEKLTDAEVDELFEDCLDEENDDGEIVYDPFLRRMCGLDPPLGPAPPAPAAKKK